MSCDATELFALDNHAEDYAKFSNPSPSELQTIEELIHNNYDLNLVFTDIQKIEGPSVNSINYQAGSKLVKFEYRSVATNALDAYVELVQYLQRSSFPTISLLANKNKSFVTHLDHESALIVQDFIVGHYCQGTYSQISAVISAWNLLEKLMANFTPASNFTTRFNNWQPQKLYTESLNKYQHFVKEHNFDLLFNTSNRINFEQITNYYHIHSTKFICDRIRHTDLHPHNLLFNHNQLLAFLDIEAFAYAPFITSFGVMLFKQIRKGISRKVLSSEQVKQLLSELAKNYVIEELAYGAKIDIVKKITIILDLYFVHGNQSWNHDLKKQLNALEEIDLVFSIR